MGDALGHPAWKREYHVYQSGLLDGLLDGFAVPHCYYVEMAPDTCTLWREEIREELPTWSLDRFGVAARHLGLLNGLYLAERTLPDCPWLTTDIVQQKERRGEMLARLDELRQHAIVRRGWPDDVAEGIQRLWREREQYYRALHRLPRVFQHGDAGRRNLMSRTGQNGETETVAIDWGMSGVGAVGEEIAPTVCATVFWFQGVTPAQLPELEEKVLDGYLQGLHQAGWRGDPRLAQLGYLCTAALRYGPLILSPEMGAAGASAEQWAMMEQRFGWSIEEWADRLVQLRRFVIERAERARQLVAELW